MSIRTVAGIITGIFIWWLLFFILTMLLAISWPDFAQAGSLAIESQDYSALTSPMLLVLLVMWWCAFFIAGLVTVLITHNQLHSLVMAVPWFIYLAVMHLYVEWSSFPPWYNLGIVLMTFPLPWLGGGLARRKATSNK